MNTVLEINNLSYKNILKNLSLKLEENTFNVLLGKNGSGKTILCKIIFGLLDFDGEIKVLSENLNEQNIDLIRKSIGLLTSDNELVNDTVLNNIQTPLLNLKYSKQKAKKIATEITQNLGISDLLYKNINELSKIDKKKVMICSILAHNPKLIIIDDTLMEFDNLYRAHLINYLKSISSTVLFVTNNEEDMLTADNVLILNEGKIDVYNDFNLFYNDDKILSKINYKTPFIIDLSSKLSIYNLLDELELDAKSLVDKIWK